MLFLLLKKMYLFFNTSALVTTFENKLCVQLTYFPFLFYIYEIIFHIFPYLA